MNEESKQLLILAAKAYGLKLIGEWNELHQGCLYEIAPCSLAVWNPLLNSAQALNLACKLKLIIECGSITIDVRYDIDTLEEFVLDDAGMSERCCEHEHYNKAVNRAIVRAAAEIGSLM